MGPKALREVGDLSRIRMSNLFSAYELVKIKNWTCKLDAIGDSRIKYVSHYSFHFAWPCRVVFDLVKNRSKLSGRINQQCAIASHENTRPVVAHCHPLSSLSCRFWLVGQHNADGLYDIVFCHICRKEEFDFFLCLTKIIKGGTHTLSLAPQAIKSMIGAIPKQVKHYLNKGVFLEGEEEGPEAPPAPDGAVSPYTDLTQHLGDRLTEYELVEDLIERGTLEENADGTLSLRLQ